MSSAAIEGDALVVPCTYGDLTLPAMNTRQAIDMAEGYLHRCRALSRTLWCAAGSGMELESSEVCAVADLMADLATIAEACVGVVASKTLPLGDTL